MKFKEFIKDFTKTAKGYIAYYETIKDLTGEEKKLRLDKKMCDYAELILSQIKINPILTFIIKNFIIKNIPAITQAVFDLIKTSVKGITEENAV